VGAWLARDKAGRDCAGKNSETLSRASTASTGSVIAGRNTVWRQNRTAFRPPRPRAFDLAFDLDFDLDFDLGRPVKPRWPEFDIEAAGESAWMPV